MGQGIDIDINDGSVGKRNSFLSFLLSFVFIGLGQMYNGQLKKGIIYLLLLFPLYLVVGLFGMQYFAGLVALVVVIIGYKIFVAIEAYKTSKRIGEFIPKKYNHVLGYILYVGFYVMIIYSGVAVNKQLIGYNSYAINTTSMLPNLYEGDRVITMPVEEYLIGDIIAFNLEDGLPYIARIVGESKQTISINEDFAKFGDSGEIISDAGTVKDNEWQYQVYNSILSNGRKIRIQKISRYLDYAFPETKYSQMESMLIPSNHAFVMGDNRNNSVDSREYGPVPKEDIIGRVMYIFWGKTFNRMGIEF